MLSQTLTSLKSNDQYIFSSKKRCHGLNEEKKRDMNDILLYLYKVLFVSLCKHGYVFSSLILFNQLFLPTSLSLSSSTSTTAAATTTTTPTYLALDDTNRNCPNSSSLQSTFPLSSSASTSSSSTTATSFITVSTERWYRFRQELTFVLLQGCFVWWHQQKISKFPFELVEILKKTAISITATTPTTATPPAVGISNKPLLHSVDDMHGFFKDDSVLNSSLNGSEERVVREKEMEGLLLNYLWSSSLADKKETYGWGLELEETLSVLKSK
eukprot:Awhi_evm1s7551